MVHSILVSDLTVFFPQPLSKCSLWSTARSYTLHLKIHALFFTKLFSYFLETCQHHLNPFCTNTASMSSIPSLYLNLSREPICYFNITQAPNYSHLSLMKCKLVLFLHWPHFTAMLTYQKQPLQRKALDVGHICQSRWGLGVRTTTKIWLWHLLWLGPPMKISLI